VALLAGCFGMLGLHRLNRHLRISIDRRFFREAYDPRLLLTSLSEAVREVPSSDALVGLVAGRVREALHPEAVRLYVREDPRAPLLLAYPRPPGEPEEAPSSLVGRLSGMDHVLAFEGDETGPDGIVL